MTIRKAMPDDVPAIRRCAEEAYAQYVEAMGRKPAPMVADFARQVADGQVDVSVTESGELQGYVIFHPDGDAMHLENIAVGQSWTGKGIGGALIAHCEDAARKQGLSAVELYTNIKMVANQTLYPRLGYAETHRAVQDGFSRIFYRKVLDTRKPG